MSRVSIDRLLAELEKVTARREELLTELRSALALVADDLGQPRKRNSGVKRTISPEARKRIAAAAKKRWAAYRAAKAKS
jgi:hypothetical protein